MSNLMNMLQSGGPRRQEYEDFVQRYDQGEPWDGITDDEAYSRHDEIQQHLSDDDYELSAAEAFERLRPDQRRELARMLRSRGRERGVDFGDDDSDDESMYEDPRRLARMTRKARKQKPDMLGQLLGGGGGGGGGGGMMGNPLAKAALAGVAAMAAKRMFNL